MVVRGSENAEVVGSGDSGAVLGSSVTDSGAVGSDGSLVHVVAGAGTGEEALVANNGIDVGSRTLEEVEESTTVEVGLLEVEVELGALVTGGREEVEETLELETTGEVVGELKLGVQSVGGVPGLGEGKAWVREIVN